MRAAAASATWAMWATWAVWAALAALAAGQQAVRVELHSGAPPPEALAAGAETEGAPRYHERVGEPLAEALRSAEAVAPAAGGGASRIAGGLGSYLGEHPFFVSRREPAGPVE